MCSVALKGIYAENYSVFAERVEFTCVSDASKKEHSKNTFIAGEHEINKVSYIYGTNGAGKTYFCKIVREIQNIISFSPLFMVNDNKLKKMIQNGDISNKVNGFLFDTEYRDKPTLFGIELIIDDVLYCYEFSIASGRILSELLTKKYRRTEKILDRTSPDNKDIVLKSELKSFENNKKVVREETLCLAMAAVLNNDLARVIVRAITDINVFNMAIPQLAPADLESFSDEKMEKYKRVLQKADSTIWDMKIEVSEEEIHHSKSELDDFENRDLMQKQLRVGVKTTHKLYDHGQFFDDYTDSIDFFNDESLGTVKLFTTLPYLYNVLENGGTLILDEIENGMHFRVVREMIALFIDEESNPKGAQLICTTHQPLLINENVKRDQVWIISKNEVGKSRMQRMSKDASSKVNVSLMNKIIEGALGYKPESFFKNNLFTPVKGDRIF